MKSKTTSQLHIFMTGANGGLGLETAKALVKQGVRTLTLGARTLSKSQGAKKALFEAAKKGNTQLVTAGGFDMRNADAIELAVQQLPKQVVYDVVFLQSGGVFFTDDYQYNVEDDRTIEATIYQNAIGGLITYYMLLKYGLVARDARVVFAGGEGARGIPGMIANPEFDGYASFQNYLFGEGTLPKYNPMNAIGVSKLVSAIMVMKLAENANQKSFVWFSPGLTGGTNGLKDNPPIKRFVMEQIMFPIAKWLGFSQSAQQGALKYVDALLGKYGENGDVLASPRGKTLGPIVDQKPMNKHLSDPLFMAALWKDINQLIPQDLVAA